MATTLARVLIAADVAGEAAERAWPATLLQPGTARLALGMPLAVGSVAGVKAVAGSLLNDLGVAASVVAVAGGVLGVCQAATRIYNRTAGSRCDLARRLNGLAAGVTLRYVEERSGTPAFARTIVLLVMSTPFGPTYYFHLAPPGGRECYFDLAPREGAGIS